MFVNLVKSAVHNVGVVLVGLGMAYLGTKVDSFVGISAFSSTLAKTGGLILLGLGFLVRLWATYHFYAHQMRVISLEPQSTVPAWNRKHWRRAGVDSTSLKAR